MAGGQRRALETLNPETLKETDMAQARNKPAKVTVILEDGASEMHDLAADKDWAVIFEDVLEIKSRGGVHYYPFASILKWTVTPAQA
jgi:hypothetical protein